MNPNGLPPGRDSLAGLRRSPLALCALGMVCGLGLLFSGVTLVRAADATGLFGLIRSEFLDRVARAVRVHDRSPEVVAPQARLSHNGFVRPRHQEVERERPERDARVAPVEARPHRAVPRRARTAFASRNHALHDRRTVCVRTCDGYAFPLGTLQSRADIPTHEASCASACPGAATQLYTLAPGLSLDQAAKARSVADGKPYSRLPTAFLFRKEHPPACSCQGPDNVASRLPILLDPTLRRGDVVVDRKGGAQVFAGGTSMPHKRSAFADFRKSKALTRQAQAKVDKVMGVSQREAMARDFKRQLRIREASLREEAAPAGTAQGVRVYRVTATGGQVDASGARIIRPLFVTVR